MRTLMDYEDAVKRYRSVQTGLPEELRISTGPGGFSTWYAPFEYVNRNAQIVLCGITPGIQQADAALVAARDSLVQGQSIDSTVIHAKSTGSFAGVMRTNLASMLDHVGVNQLLGIDSCSRLFGDRADLVHYTSALRNPVLSDGVNYSGDSKMMGLPYLWDQILEGIKAEASVLPRALWIPLGPQVGNVFEKLVEMNVIEQGRCLAGLPHASGENAERIKYFLGEKSREKLSSKTNAQLIDDRRCNLVEKVDTLSHQDELIKLPPEPGEKEAPIVEPNSCVLGLETKSSELVIRAQVSRGKNKGQTLSPHQHPGSEGRYVVSKTRFVSDYIYLDTLREIPQYLDRGYGLRMSMPGTGVAPSLVVPSSITVG
jgi:hypothetical protein